MLVDHEEHTLDAFKAGLLDVCEGCCLLYGLGTHFLFEEVVDLVERDPVFLEEEFEPVEEKLLILRYLTLGEEDVPNLVKLFLLDVTSTEVEKLPDECKARGNVRAVREWQVKQLHRVNVVFVDRLLVPFGIDPLCVLAQVKDERSDHAVLVDEGMSDFST